MRRRVYNATAERDLAVLWRERFQAFASEAPRAVDGAHRLCRWLAASQWPYCRPPARAQSAIDGLEPPRPVAYSTLQLVSMPCAFADGGANYKGALYDASRVLNAQHASATPSYAAGALLEFDVAAIGLTPYGHETDAHFYASTAPWVLQLLEVLPPVRRSPLRSRHSSRDCSRSKA